ncbi:MAG: hypothetical protein J6A94_02255 [Lachnospiraceae bacterium]|nr:hypothetical protein [Lachnospiraceae bacterium]
MNGYDSNKEFVTSVITMEEYFVFPYRNNNYSLIDMFGFKAMDAIQLAVACFEGCDLFLTNDK